MNIYILSNSQVDIKALEGFQINSKLVCNCHQFLVKLVAHNRIQLAWMPGHMGIDGNESADQLATECSSHPLTGTQPAHGISAEVSKGVMDWTSRKNKEHWQSICGHKAD